MPLQAPDRNTLAVASCAGIATSILAILPNFGILIPPPWGGLIVAIAAVIPSHFVPQSFQEVANLAAKLGILAQDVKIEPPDSPKPSR